MAKKQETVTSIPVASVDDLGSLYEIKGRYFFTDDRSILELPELIEVQFDSYHDFLNNKLNKAFEDTFPIQDFS
jgi:DNA-directed RNA polymerase beta subunit